MEMKTIKFVANQQTLARIKGQPAYASNVIRYIQVEIQAQDPWTSFDSVELIFQSDRKKITKIPELSGGVFRCTVPQEMALKISKVFMNLVGKNIENGSLVEKLTTYPCLAFIVNAYAQEHGLNEITVTANQYDQFVENVNTKVKRIEDLTVSAHASNEPEVVKTSSGGGAYNLDFGLVKGDTGETGNGIANAQMDEDYALTLHFTDGTSYTTPSIRGEQGNTGDDGFSPVVEVEEITGGHTVTITDAEGDHSFNVMDGRDSTNVQSDWDEADSTSDAYILNKPTIPSKTSDLTNDSNFVSDNSYVHTDNNYTTTEKNKLTDIESGAEANILESVKVNNTALPISNKAVNIDLSGYATKSDISSVYKFKGTVANYSNLPSSGQTAGDVYNITNADATHDISAGDNVAWTGSAWDKLAGDIDLSNYVEKETGKGLSSNDYTTAEKNKLSGIESGAEVNVQVDWNQSYSTEDDYIKNKPNLNGDLVRDGSGSDYISVHERYDINTKYKLALSDHIPSWAKQSTKPTYTASEVGALPDDTPLFSGDYNDLTNKPTIPIKYAGGALDVTSETVYLRVHDDSQTCNVAAIATDTVSGISGLYFLLNDGTPDGKMIFIPDANGFNTGSQAIIAQIPTNVSDLTNDSGYISSETDPVFSASAAHGISSSDITNWNGKSDFSGSYNDLSNKPTIPVVGHTIPYGTCSTAKGTVAKVATVSGVTELTEGLTIAVKFSAENTSTNPTLNVNSLGAVAIKKYGTTAAGTSAAMSWYAGSVCILIYDGTYWQMVNWDNTNTTYTSMTVAEYEAGTGTTARSITPARLKGAIETWADKTEVTQTLTSGTEIGEVNGTKLYAPSGGGSNTPLFVHEATGVYDNNYDPPRLWYNHTWQEVYDAFLNGQLAYTGADYIDPQIGHYVEIFPLTYISNMGGGIRLKTIFGVDSGGIDAMLIRLFADSTNGYLYDEMAY